jgi:uncharacterized Tic20 family protein
MQGVLSRIAESFKRTRTGFTAASFVYEQTQSRDTGNFKMDLAVRIAVTLAMIVLSVFLLRAGVTTARYISVVGVLFLIYVI